MGSPNIIPAQYDPRSPSYTLLYTTTKLITLYHDQTKFFTSSKMMLGYPSYSAERRQRCTTTTIRSRRAHSRRVLDTAALNAYVPNDVGSKSHSELTWNHVVYVFTFFGLLMTALVSLCCWSHFQFIVERRRLAAEGFDGTTSIKQSIHGNSLPCYRRRLAEDEVTIERAGEPGVNGTYTIQTGVPGWDKDSLKEYLGGSNDILRNEQGDYAGFKTEIMKNKSTMPWYKKKATDMVIFWCGSQQKWHLCGNNKLLYRSKHVPGTADDAVPQKCGEYNKATKVAKEGWMTDFKNSGTKGGTKTFSKGKPNPPFF